MRLKLSGCRGSEGESHQEKGVRGSVGIHLFEKSVYGYLISPEKSDLQ